MSGKVESSPRLRLLPSSICSTCPSEVLTTGVEGCASMTPRVESRESKRSRPRLHIKMPRADKRKADEPKGRDGVDEIMTGVRNTPTPHSDSASSSCLPRSPKYPRVPAGTDKMSEVGPLFQTPKGEMGLFAALWKGILQPTWQENGAQLIRESVQSDYGRSVA